MFSKINHYYCFNYNNTKISSNPPMSQKVDFFSKCKQIRKQRKRDFPLFSEYIVQRLDNFKKKIAIKHTVTEDIRTEIIELGSFAIVEDHLDYIPIKEKKSQIAQIFKISRELQAQKFQYRMEVSNVYDLVKEISSDLKFNLQKQNNK